ncbi:hypothetical protein DM02DRAFT_728832 [Periconia macrospinosa]|uniref:F-box domain-containing protein n=1 Tax=Periconia macrospinosa TaxID=97972 RepID=A0A2V1DPT4_9PLEO|nr:hypothetical protein DM02DRAFT_728832 [Periconia macrospinosa]
MSQSIKIANSTATAENSRCYLLKLPTEIQLQIYELALVKERPLLLNYPCNSSYRGRPQARIDDEQKWRDGEIQAPEQPALTLTCHFLRETTLPIFYGKNVFRAAYCYTDSNRVRSPIAWLRRIGPRNREMLRHFYFYDLNHTQDITHPQTLQRLKDSEVFRELGGRMETLSSEYCSAHLVTFGEQKGKAKGTPAASEPGVPRLRMEEEVQEAPRIIYRRMRQRSPGSLLTSLNGYTG